MKIIRNNNIEIKCFIEEVVIDSVTNAQWILMINQWKELSFQQSSVVDQYRSYIMSIDDIEKTFIDENLFNKDNVEYFSWNDSIFKDTVIRYELI